MAAELEDRRHPTSDPHESDGEDSASLSLSLCGISLGGNDASDGPFSSDVRQLSPRPPIDPFEFFTGDHPLAEEMCSADDVFHQGQLLPYKPPPLQPSPAKTSDAPAPKIATLDHRRSQSLDGINRRRAPRLASKYRRLRRAASDSDPRTPLQPTTQPPATSPRSRRPKWFLVVFGPVRVPAAMEMKDIRNRQRRQRLLSLAECGGSRYEEGRGPWKLLQSLSCKGADSVAVSPPLKVVSHVRR